jgi:hypothetical protein
MRSTHVYYTYQLKLLEIANHIFEEITDKVRCVRPPLLSTLPLILINA